MRKYFLLLLLVFWLLSPGRLLADECLEGDCDNGIGKGFTDDGAIYAGEWRDGMPNGHGTLFLARGKSIEGRWEKGALLPEEAPPEP